MNRRDFLLAGATGAAAMQLSGCIRLRPAVPSLGTVMTVRGAIAPAEMGATLPHEHVIVDFAPAEEAGRSTYDPLEVVETALPFLMAARESGVRSLVDATPAYLGRDPLVLRALSERTGLHILTNTGYYGARGDVHLADHVFDESAHMLADRWIREWNEGIGDTSVRPGFMKIGVDPQFLSDVDAKLIRAAAIAHLSTGLTIASHTGPADAAFDQLHVLEEEGVHPSAWIWVHAHAEEDLSAHVDAARRGAWIEFDGLRPGSIDRHVELIANMKRHRLLGRVLVSHDAGWYSVGQQGGGGFRGYDTLFAGLVPALREDGFSDAEIDRLVIRNPAEAFRIRIRKLGP